VSVSARHLLGGPLIRRVVAAFFAASFATVLATVLAATGQAQTAADADPEETRARLEQLERDIARISREQRSREQERGVLQSKLRQSEEQLGSLRKAQARTREAITEIRDQVSALRTEIGELEAASAGQREAVAAEVRAAFKGGENDQLQLLLSEDDPQQLARMFAYYRYILGARAELLDEYRLTLQSLENLQLQLDRRQNALDTQSLELSTQERELLATRKTRREVLTQIDKALQDSAATLAAREQDRTQLESLLEEIDRALAQLMPQESVEPFSAARGSMPWPVDGRITTRFGASRNLGKMRWQGVRMAAEPGSTVTAIHHGRVVYADWLRGSGLLLVIDHGDGYMSLYAHNESLLRDVGDWVTAGAPVSTVGDSGGQSEPGLYFEIRRNGKPTDPQQWCRS
jgi:septal ring factor EnvC (AmiA/AmiB activator)